MKKDVEILESYINDIPIIINPCRLCVNCTGVQDGVTTHLVENCKDCCYFYGSKFEAKKVEICDKWELAE